LDHKTRVTGMSDPSVAFDMAFEAHRVADDFLKGHLAEVRKLRPDLAPDLEKLTGLNRKIAAWNSVRALMSHKAGREFWKKEGRNRLLDGAGTAMGVAGIAATGQLVGATAALLPIGMRFVGSGLRGLDRRATAALASLERAARAGNVTRRMILDALKAGVPLATANAAASAARTGQRALAEDDE
jgi:hypothetical protein